MEYIRLWRLMPVVALALSVSSCTNDNEPNTSGNNSGDVFTIKANIGEILQSRATVNAEDGASFIWQNDDKFDLYQSTDMAKANTFAIENSSIAGDGKSADFICNDFAPADAASYYAFYPQGFTKGEGSAFTYTIPETAYTQTGNNNTDHLKNGMIMVADGETSGLVSGISFTHKTALFRFSVMNLTGADLTVKSINLSSAGTACFAKQYSYTVDGAESIESIGDKVSELNLGFGEGVAIANDAELKAYTLAIPGDALTATGESLTLEVVSDNGFVFSKTFEITAETKFEAGKYYTFNVDITFPLAEAVVTNLGPDFEANGNDAAGWTKSTSPAFRGNSLSIVNDVNCLAFNGDNNNAYYSSYLYQNMTLPQGTYKVEIDVAEDDNSSGRDGVVFGILNGHDTKFPSLTDATKKPWYFTSKDGVYCEYNLTEGHDSDGGVVRTHTTNSFNLSGKSDLSFGFGIMLAANNWLRVSAIRIIVLMD